MTLLVNEIHVPGDIRRSFILQAADRRVTVNGRFHSNRRKVFPLGHLSGGVGYFGLTMLDYSTYFSDWLPNIIRKAATTGSLQEFAHFLHGKLNRAVDKGILAKHPSGFHVCGFNPDGYPELWFIRNIGGMDGYTYTDFASEYYISEDFLTRDACGYGFDGVTSEVSKAFVHAYVNGDVRPFHASWPRLDAFLDEMFHQPDFKLPKEVSDLVPIVKWKMKTIATFYAEFAKMKIIGGRIDAFVLLPTQASYAPPSQSVKDSEIRTHKTTGIVSSGGSTVELGTGLLGD